MKFAEFLAENLVPEWKDKYLDYKGGKKKIKKIANSPTLTKLTKSFTNQNSSNTTSLPASGRFTDFRFKQSKKEREESFALPPAALDPNEVPPNQSTPLLSGATEAPKPISSATSLHEPNNTPQQIARRRDFHSIANPESYSVGSALLNDGVPLENSRDTNILEFTDWLNKELAKIEVFYKQKEDKSVERYLLLQDQLYNLKEEKIRLKAKNRIRPDDRLVKTGIAKTTKELYKINKYDLPSLPKFNFRREKSTSHSRKDYEPHKREVPYYVARRQIRSALQEYYRSLELLKSYRMLNRTGFRKLLKKFDKQTNSTLSATYMDKVNESYFASSDVLDNLLPKVEDLFSTYFEHGNRKVAVEKLRSNINEDQYYTSLFFSGIFYGLSVPLLIESIYLILHKTFNREIPQGKFLIQIWAGFLMVLLMVILFGLTTYIWTKFKVNYRFIFEFDPRTVLDYRQFHLIPSILLFGLSLFGWIGFNNFWPTEIDPIYWPWFFFGFAAILLVMPVDLLFWESRKWLLLTVWRLALSGLYPVEFKDFFLGDIFCSLTYTMGNLSFFFCMYATHWDGAIGGDPSCGSSRSRAMGFFSALPPVWRLLQCIRRYADSGDWFPHLANMVKYSITVTYYALLSVYRIDRSSSNRTVFIFFATINSIYSGLWDIFMDWSLIQERDLLRKDLTYPKAFYYFAIVSDLILRFQWIFYALFSKQVQQSAVTSFCVALAEIFRRFIWMIIRMENEHIANIHLFRAAREAPLPYETTYRTRVLGPSSEEDEETFTSIGDEEADVTQTPQSLRRRATILQSNVFQAIVNAHAKDFQRRKPDAREHDHGANSSDEDNSDDEHGSVISQGTQMS